MDKNIKDETLSWLAAVRKMLEESSENDIDVDTKENISNAIGVAARCVMVVDTLQTRTIEDIRTMMQTLHDWAFDRDGTIVAINKELEKAEAKRKPEDISDE